MVGGKQMESTANQDIVKASREPQRSKAKQVNLKKKETHTRIDKWDLCNQEVSQRTNDPKDRKSVV